MRIVHIVMVLAATLAFGKVASGAEPTPQPAPKAASTTDTAPAAAADKPTAGTGQPATKPADPAAAKPAAAAPGKTETPAQPAATGQGAAGKGKRGKRYRSPMRIQCEHGLAIGKWEADCEDEFRKDQVWQRQWASVIKKDLKPEVHRTEAQRISTNNRHVVMAYAGLWILAVGFLVLMWLRQAKLMNEIERLESELKKAVAEDE